MNSLHRIIKNVLKKPSTSNLHKLVTCIISTPSSDENLVQLSRALAHSGEVVKFQEFEDTIDLASTGGPSSLTTLLTPLYLRAFGHYVPKLGVPGRPAGGIDVIAQLPGFKFKINSKTLYTVLKKSGYAHFLADEIFAPLDVELFRFRQKIKAQAIPQFVIASILSKKIAVGVGSVGLDVRVAPHGNFGASWNEAKTNAKQFCRVAKLLGIKAVCLLTDGRFPYQPYLGRGESLQALDNFFENNECSSLRNHTNLCFAIAQIITSKDIKKRPTPQELKKLFSLHLKTQGSSILIFKETVNKIKKECYFDIYSKEKGFFQINLEKLRFILSKLQQAHWTYKNPFPDTCGIIFQAMPGDYISKGDLIAKVRIAPSLKSRMFPEINKAFSAFNRPLLQKTFEEVR